MQNDNLDRPVNQSYQSLIYDECKEITRHKSPSLRDHIFMKHHLPFHELRSCLARATLR